MSIGGGKDYSIRESDYTIKTTSVDKASLSSHLSGISSPLNNPVDEANPQQAKSIDLTPPKTGSYGKMLFNGIKSAVNSAEKAVSGLGKRMHEGAETAANWSANKVVLKGDMAPSKTDTALGKVAYKGAVLVSKATALTVGIALCITGGVLNAMCSLGAMTIAMSVATAVVAHTAVIGVPLMVVCVVIESCFWGRKLGPGLEEELAKLTEKFGPETVLSAALGAMGMLVAGAGYNTGLGQLGVLIGSATIGICAIQCGAGKIGLEHIGAPIGTVIAAPLALMGQALINAALGGDAKPKEDALSYRFATEPLTLICTPMITGTGKALNLASEAVQYVRKEGIKEGSAAVVRGGIELGESGVRAVKAGIHFVGEQGLSGVAKEGYKIANKVANEWVEGVRSPEELMAREIDKMAKEMGTGFTAPSDAALKNAEENPRTRR